MKEKEQYKQSLTFPIIDNARKTILEILQATEDPKVYLRPLSGLVGTIKQVVRMGPVSITGQEQTLPEMDDFDDDDNYSNVPRVRRMTRIAQGPEDIMAGLQLAIPQYLASMETDKRNNLAITALQVRLSDQTLTEAERKEIHNQLRTFIPGAVIGGIPESPQANEKGETPEE